MTGSTETLAQNLLTARAK